MSIDNICYLIDLTIFNLINIKKTNRKYKIVLLWSGQRDLNPRPSAPQTDALPSCAMARNKTIYSKKNVANKKAGLGLV